jgi:ATP-dependent DNA helicase RecG
MTTSRRQTVFASLDPPQAWPATRAHPQPARLAFELDVLQGVGITLKRRLAKLGLVTMRDLLEHRPHRYESAVDEVAIAALGGSSEKVAIAGEVLSVSKRPLRGRRTMVTARVTDGTATISAAWFNQPWLADQLQPGVHVRLRGKPGRYGFDVKSHDIGAGDATADFAPVYPASEEITPKRMRTLVTAALGHVSDYFDPLPAELREREGMPLKRDRVVGAVDQLVVAKEEKGVIPP